MVLSVVLCNDLILFLISQNQSTNPSVHLKFRGTKAFKRGAVVCEGTQ